MRKTLFAALVVMSFFCLPVSAVAGPITPAAISVFSAPTKTYQNTANSPCIFYGNEHGQPCPKDPALWPTPAGGTGTGNDHVFALTQDYTGSEFTTFFGTATGSFVLGFDINQAKDAQTLTGFTIAFDGVPTDPAGFTTYYSFSGSLAVPDLANGVGWADYILAAGCAGTAAGTPIPGCGGPPDFPYSPFVIPTGATSAHFTFNFNGNDGADRIFVIPAGTPPTPVPEPASLLLLGTGLAAAARAARQRRGR